MRNREGLIVAAALAFGVGLVASCGGSSKSDILGGQDNGPDGSVAGNDGGSGNASDGGPSSAKDDAAAGKDGSVGPCTGVGCNVSACNGKAPTSLVGQVFDPAGKNALYNVIAYVPADPGAPLPKFSATDRCGATPLNPVTSALTDETGTFTLRGVPTMKGLPVVIQIGKWRKKITFDITNDCGENKITGKILLPRNGSEGEMPQIAVTTGGCDALECLLLGMGIDQNEFKQGNDPTGHVHLYQGNGGTTGVDAQSMLWNDAALLGNNDLVALSCECDEHNENKTNKQAMHDYVNAGGRVLATHYHHTWFSNGPQMDFKDAAQWTPNGAGVGGPNYTVEQAFPKGHAFAQWLVNVGASTTLGQVPLSSVASDLTGVNAPTQAWIDANASSVKLFTFNAPIGAAPASQVGRVVYTDLHVSGSGGEAFPSGCLAPGNALSAQQKALEFMLFDLSACVQSDATPPTPPK